MDNNKRDNFIIDNMDKLFIISLIIFNGFLLGTGIHSVIRAENNNQLDGWEWVFIVLLIVDFCISSLYFSQNKDKCRIDRCLLIGTLISTVFLRLFVNKDVFGQNKETMEVREDVYTALVVLSVLFTLNKIYTSYKEYNLIKKDSEILPVRTNTIKPSNKTGQYKNLRY